MGPYIEALLRLTGHWGRLRSHASLSSISANTFLDQSSNLDLLRAFAVACVFVSHLFPTAFSTGNKWDGIGKFGVLIFFVHTSYVLLASLSRSGENWRSFQIRRIFRIYPLSIIAVLIYACIAPTTGFDLFSNLFLVQNLTGAQSSPRQLWSLPFEMQMYLVLPFLLTLSITRGRNAIKRLFVGSVLLLLIAVVLGVNVYPLSYGPCFVSGALLFTAHINNKRLPAVALPMLLVTCAGLLYGNAIGINPMFGWFICLLVAWFIPYVREIRREQIRASAKTIAKYSYGIYLFHDLAIDAGAKLSPKPLVIIVISLLLTSAISFGLYHLVESPMIIIGKRISGLVSRPATELAHEGTEQRMRSVVSRTG